MLDFYINDFETKEPEIMVPLSILLNNKKVHGDAMGLDGKLIITIPKYWGNASLKIWPPRNSGESLIYQIKENANTERKYVVKDHINAYMPGDTLRFKIKNRIFNKIFIDDLGRKYKLR